MFAMVVLPTPGGPHKIIEGTIPFSIAVLSMLPLPVRCCWPARSLSEVGRILSANGVVSVFINKVTKSTLKKALYNFKQNGY